MLDGWSKTYAMTGWRLGFSVWPKALVEHVVRLAVNCHSCVNAPTQYAGIAALEGPQDEVHKMVAAFDERRRVIVPLLNQLPGFKCLDPGGAFYVFPDITGTGMDARELQNKMLEKAGVATVAGTSFGIHGEGFIRFSYANSVENIREAVKRIAALLDCTHRLHDPAHGTGHRPVRRIALFSPRRSLGDCPLPRRREFGTRRSSAWASHLGRPMTATTVSRPNSDLKARRQGSLTPDRVDAAPSSAPPMARATTWMLRRRIELERRQTPDMEPNCRAATSDGWGGDVATAAPI